MERFANRQATPESYEADDRTENVKKWFRTRYSSTQGTSKGAKGKPQRLNAG